MIDFNWDGFGQDMYGATHRAISGWRKEDADVMRIDPSCNNRYVKECCFRGTISRAGSPSNSEKNGVSLTLTSYVATGTLIDVPVGFALEHGDMIVSRGPYDGCREMRLMVEAVVFTNDNGITVTLTRVS